MQDNLANIDSDNSNKSNNNPVDTYSQSKLAVESEVAIVQSVIDLVNIKDPQIFTSLKLNGFLINVNKPLEWTSFDVVRSLKRYLPKKAKIGHAGTLDPLASGVLILAVGIKTKTIDTIQAQPKTYIAEITLGATTVTYDNEIPPKVINDSSLITDEAIKKVINTFVGNIEQTPPIYSALKHEGKPLYEYARENKEFDVKSKTRVVEITSIAITDIKRVDKLDNLNQKITIINITVCCAKGTYIRSLAHDIGQALGCGGYLTSLIRTSVGEYTIEGSVELSHCPQVIQRELYKILQISNSLN